jgi:hypothetical protein
MEKRLKKTVTRNFRAKDIDWEYFECIEEVSSNIKEYNEEGAILREMLSSIDFTLYKYEDGKLVKKWQFWPSSGIIDCNIEYDSEGNKKPYTCTQISEGREYNITFDVTYDEEGRRIEEEYGELDGTSEKRIYENGKCILEYNFCDEHTFTTYYTYDSKGRLVFEKSEIATVFVSGDRREYHQYDYDDEDNLLLETIAIEEQREGQEEFTTKYYAVEHIRENGLLVKKVKYGCKAESIEQFFNCDVQTTGAIENTDYIRKEMVVESTPYMAGEAGPFVVRTVNEMVDNEQMKKNIEIYSKDGDTLLKSIEATGHYNLYEATDDYMTVTETRYEYYE